MCATPNQNPEQIARDNIDALLRASGWAIQKKDVIDFNEGEGQAIREYHTNARPADYVLFIGKKPIGVIEAKHEGLGHKITGVEEQTGKYATAKLQWIEKGEPLPFLYEATDINTTQLGEAPIPLCSLPEQQEIVRLLEEQFTVIEQNEREIAAALKRSAALRQSILKRAFSGQLVPPACRRADKPPLSLPLPQSGKWWVYVLKCTNGSYYKGFTEDLTSRWARHKAGTACRHTKQFPPEHVFYYEEHSSQAAAISREKFLKSGAGREWFNAEVVAKPIEWEPARVLLERIQKERKVKKTAKKKTARKRNKRIL